MKKDNEENITIDSLKNKVNTYMKKDWPLIYKAYTYATHSSANNPSPHRRTVMTVTAVMTTAAGCLRIIIIRKISANIFKQFTDTFTSLC